MTASTRIGGLCSARDFSTRCGVEFKRRDRFVGQSHPNHDNLRKLWFTSIWRARRLPFQGRECSTVPRWEIHATSSFPLPICGCTCRGRLAPLSGFPRRIRGKWRDDGLVKHRYEYDRRHCRRNRTLRDEMGPVSIAWPKSATPRSMSPTTLDTIPTFTLRTELICRVPAASVWRAFDWRSRQRSRITT